MNETTESSSPFLFDAHDIDKIKENSLHYYALSCTAGWYESFKQWGTSKWFYKPGTEVYNRTKAVVTYDRIINNEKRLEKNLEKHWMLL